MTLGSLMPTSLVGGLRASYSGVGGCTCSGVVARQMCAYSNYFFLSTRTPSLLPEKTTEYQKSILQNYASHLMKTFKVNIYIIAVNGFDRDGVREGEGVVRREEIPDFVVHHLQANVMSIIIILKLEGSEKSGCLFLLFKGWLFSFNFNVNFSPFAILLHVVRLKPHS